MPNSKSSVAREMRAVHLAFRQLATAFGRLAPLLHAAPKVAVAANGQPRRKPRLSGKQRAALKLQGRYMGKMRGLTAAKRAKVKRVRAEKGIKAAIRAAERMGR